MNATHIVINDLNKVRWLCPNQSFSTNVIRYSEEAVSFLNQNNVSYTLATREWGRYQKQIKETEEAVSSYNNHFEIDEVDDKPLPRISGALSGLINSLGSDWF